MFAVKDNQRNLKRHLTQIAQEVINGRVPKCIGCQDANAFVNGRKHPDAGLMRLMR